MSRGRRGFHQCGFSTIEACIALGIMLAVTAGIFSVVHPAQNISLSEPERVDMQQRIRVAADTLTRELMLAGAGAYLGAQAGPLVMYLPPILPYRHGAIGADPPGTMASDRLTLVYIPSTAAETTLTSDLMPGSAAADVAAEAGCASGANLCGFAKNMTVLVFDDSGNHDLFTVASVADGTLQLVLDTPPGAASTTYPAGSKVVEATSRTYSLKPDATTGALQLTAYDGSRNADVPVLDHVVGLSFEYFGESSPPAIVRSLDEESGPWTNYGPKPPAASVKSTAYPPGENCAFSRDADGQAVSRLTTLSTVPGLVRLTAEQLTDGPWCPDASNANRWDADLLRVRRIAITVRVEAALAALRGPAGPLFVNAGTSRGGSRWVADEEVHFDVAPRNLNLGR